MINLLEQILSKITLWPWALLAVFLFVLFFPRKASYLVAFGIAAAVAYGFITQGETYEAWLLGFFTSNPIGIRIFELANAGYTSASYTEDSSLNTAEVAFTSGVYMMLQITVVGLIFGGVSSARSYVKTSIRSIGSRPLDPKRKIPMI